MSQPPPSQGQASPSKTRRMDIRDLLGGEREIILVHEGDEYRLRITSNRKLILTK